MTKFYDTSALLENYDKLFSDSQKFIISSQTLIELENIKTSANKDSDIKYKARRLCRILDENIGKFEVAVNTEVDLGMPITPDNIILTTAYRYNKYSKPIVFVTNDIACKIIAETVYGLSVKSIDLSNMDDYTGYKEVIMSNEEMAYLYENLDKNDYDCLINEYFVIKNVSGEIVDVMKYDGQKFVSTWKKGLKTIAFGDIIKPKDVYQRMTIDSIMTNDITAISGKAGTGKSFISLVSAMYLIENGKYDRIVVLFNPTKTKGATGLGYYSGNALEKAIQSNIGQTLISKFGDNFSSLIAQDKLKLICMTDIRGYEVKNNEILFITECQNTSIELLKLCLSRASEGCKVIIEGDFDAQVDNYAFEGSSNGLKRAVEVFKGENIFGFVKLQNIYRSRIAELAEKM